MSASPYSLQPARILSRRDEAEGVYTFTMRFTDAEVRKAYRFSPGQFNMLYVDGVGEVPISIVSDPDEPTQVEHTVRVVGRVTKVMGEWKKGDIVGVRGPYGRGWPMHQALGRDVLIVTGGLGCAPVVGVINYIFRRREQYGELHILHGVKSPNDLLYRARFDEFRSHPRTHVHLTADNPTKTWRYHVGVVTTLFDELTIEPSTIVMMCGPEVMMRYATRSLRDKGVDEDSIFLSMERNMKCGVQLCGHCQIGPFFCCTDGPVFRYSDIRPWFGKAGA